MPFKALRWFQVLHILFSYFKIAHNGRSHLMMNTIIRDKRQAERLEFDQLKQELETYEEIKLEIQDLWEQLKMHQRNDKNDSKDADILNKLFKMGKNWLGRQSLVNMNSFSIPVAPSFFCCLTECNEKFFSSHSILPSPVFVLLFSLLCFCIKLSDPEQSTLFGTF